MFFLANDWLVVGSPTHLKNTSQNGFIFPKVRGENKTSLKTTTQMMIVTEVKSISEMRWVSFFSVNFQDFVWWDFGPKVEFDSIQPPVRVYIYI